MRKMISLDAIVGEFNPKELCNSTGPSKLRPVTIWVSEEAKEHWDQLQKLTRRDFGRKAKEVLLAFIELTKDRAS